MLTDLEAVFRSLKSDASDLFAPPATCCYARARDTRSFSAAYVLAAPFWGDTTPQAAETPPQHLKPGQFKWKGGAIPSGPIVVVVSLAEQRAYVYRNGVQIGVSLGTHAFIMQDGWGEGKSAIAKNAPAHRWTAVGIPGHTSERGQSLSTTHRLDRIYMPPQFAKALYQILTPGATLLITDAPVLPKRTTGVALSILNADLPPS